jgi:hypothetical protein
MRSGRTYLSLTDVAQAVLGQDRADSSRPSEATGAERGGLGETALPKNRLPHNISL